MPDAPTAVTCARAIPTVSVLLFHPANGFAGAERTSTNIVKASDHSKLRFVIIAGPRAFHADEGDHFISIFDLGLSNGFGGFRRAIKDARILCHVARREGCTVALGMLHYGALVVVLMRFLSLFRIKAIASPRTPSVLGIEFHVGRTGLLAFKWRSLVNFFCRFANRIVVASEGLKGECVRHYGSKPSKVVVIPNGIDASRLPQVARAQSVRPDPCQTCRIVTFGRLAPEKDLDTLFVAFATVQLMVDSSLWIIGDGPELERLRRLSRTLGIFESVQFIGFQADPFFFVKGADIFVHTALFEGFGNVILEAMACGVPVIATDCDFGPREIVHHGMNGMLVPLRDPKRLAEAIINLCRDPLLRAELVQNGYETIGRYTQMAMVRAYEETILSLPK